MLRASLELFVAGAGPAYTDRPGATGAAYLVRGAATAVLLDFGQGSFPRLAGDIDPRDLDAIVVSHLHPDHFIDLVALRHYLRYGIVPPGRMRVFAPHGIAARIDALHDEPGFSAAALDCADIVEQPFAIGDLTIEPRLVTHTAESYGFRVALSGGESDPHSGLVYSGDCGRAADLRPLIRPGDVLLSEASFGPDPVPPGAQHLNGAAVGDLAAWAGVREVLLTHLQMGFDHAATIDSVRERFDGPVRVVEPGDRIRV
jgi:ribonuclease BN (tRNA processing enzyme)